MSANEKLTIYEMAMTTGRSARKAAGKHGFRGFYNHKVDRLAESLPDEAWIIDVGAGTSTFGNEIATRRPDVTWVNFDYSYNEPAVLESVSQKSPGNVQHIPGDATLLDQVYDHGKFDVAFSYWLFPHLSLDGNIEPARLAARAIFNVTKTGGMISIGPEMNRPFPSPGISYIRPQKAFQIVKDDSVDIERFADMVADRTYIRGAGTRYAQRLMSEVMTGYFGTSQYFRNESLLHPQVFDPENGEYVDLFSSRAAHLAGQLTVAATRYVGQTVKEAR